MAPSPSPSLSVPAPKSATTPPAALTPTASRNRPGAGGRSYEIQRQTGGRWFLDSVADEKDVAVAIAAALLQSSRPPAEVRILSVQAKPDGAFAEVTIFRATPDEIKRAAKADAIAAQPRSPVRRGAGAHRPGSPARKKHDIHVALATMKQSLVELSPRSWLVLGLVIMAWCSVFYFWRQPQKPWAFDLPAAQAVVKGPNLP